jgi:peroxiredoxin
MPSDLEQLINVAEKEWFDEWKRGPQRTRWTEIPLQVGDQAPDFELKNQADVNIRLSKHWEERPALIIFWRQYGCGCGVDRASRLKEEWKDYQQADVNVVIIAQGEPERSVAYAEKYDLPPIPILSDPDFKIYTAYGLVDGKESQIFFDAPEVFLDRDWEAGVELANARREDNPLHTAIITVKTFQITGCTWQPSEKPI